MGRPVVQQSQVSVAALHVAEAVGREAPFGPFGVAHVLKKLRDVGRPGAGARLFHAGALVEQRPEHGVHRLGVGFESAEEPGVDVRSRVEVGYAHATGQRAQVGCGLWQGMRLHVVHDLEFVFDLAQEAVGRGQRVAVRGRHVAARGQPVERGQRVAAHDAWVLAGVDELQDLGDEFDFADAAPAQLDVHPLPVAPRQRALHPRLQVVHVLDRAEIEIPAQDERRHLVQKPLAQRPRPGNRAGLEQRQPLPRLAPRLVIGQRLRDRVDERPVVAVRPQAQIDPKDEPAGRAATQGVRQAAGQFGKELPRIHPALASPRGRAGVALVHVDEVDVRTEIQFAAAQFAHPEHDERDRPSSAGFRFHDDVAVVPDETRPRVLVGALHRGIGQAAQVGHGRFEIGPGEQVAYADAQVFAVAVVPQPAQELVPFRAARQRRTDRREMRVRGLGAAVSGIEEHPLPVRCVRDEGIRQKLAGAEDEEQIRAGLRGLQRLVAAEPVFADAAQVGRGQRRVRRSTHAGGDVRPRRAETRRGQSFLQREQGTQDIRRQVHGSAPSLVSQDGGTTSATRESADLPGLSDFLT